MWRGCGQGNRRELETLEGAEVRPVGGDRVDLGVLAKGGEVVRPQVRRRDDQTANETVELDENAGGGDLTRRRHQHRTAGELRRRAAEAGGARTKGAEIRASAAVVDDGSRERGEPAFRQEPARRSAPGRRS